ncbi:hypothetical protein ACT3R7_06795 [Halomonas sp. AOP43-A1-21]|uniref:Uncharacterized protein n=1 Tax=Halomonas colorata TaxID=2742615 RepID=A0ABR9G2N8_9GAMM|nr:hypothetical protein [Halomonas colorata]MBE0465183.1 hypothetical protein [Halomonas colorata]
MIAVHQGTGVEFSAIYRRLVINQLIRRLELLEAEKYELASANQLLAAENARLKIEVAYQANQLTNLKIV